MKATRVVLIGPESTGKTRLGERLARDYDAPWSPEYARAYVAAHPGPLSYEDVDPIGRGQREGEDEAIARAQERGARCVIHDTDLVSTLVYSRHYYGRCPVWIEEAARRRRADLYLLHHADVPWVEDGFQREQPQRREALFRAFRDALKALGARSADVLGSWDERERLARDAIDALLAPAPSWT